MQKNKIIEKDIAEKRARYNLIYDIKLISYQFVMIAQ